MLVGWFDNDPTANIAIACGKRSGIVVLDIDAGKGGYESLERLQEQYGRLPETPIAKTGGGGEHVFFKHPGVEIRNSTSKLAPGIDVRGDGGYVVAAPSIHPNGTIYEWVIGLDTSLADMPEWMIGALRQPDPVPVVTNGLIANGSRNDTLTRRAGAMRRASFNEDEIYQALILYNRRNCLPPLSDGEVLQIAKSVQRYEPHQEQVTEIKPLFSPLEVIETIEAEIIEREKNPKDVWGIHYAWPFLSLVTGGKQKGELIYLGGEPKVGKSWWAHQDAMYTAIGKPSNEIPPVPTLVWSGEMKEKQVYRRMLAMLGVDIRNMRTGNMTETDWQNFNTAKAILANSPLFVSSAPLHMNDIEEFMRRWMGDHGVIHFLFDYDWHISAKGDGEIETSQTISRGMKQLAQKLDVSIMLISSVNKMGMDTTRETALKSNLSGSGKKIHDADIVYILTKLNQSNPSDEVVMAAKPEDFWRVATLHISAGRELDYHLSSGAINYLRETPSPSFREPRSAQKGDLPQWLQTAVARRLS